MKIRHVTKHIHIDTKSLLSIQKTLIQKHSFSSIMEDHHKEFSWISSFPKMVHITDVGPRDGLQNESKDKIIPATVKVELIEKLKQAGLKKIECGSFVHPKWVPQMANSGEVFDILNSKNDSDSDVTYIGLVMNQRGIERAFEKNVREVVYVLSASEEFAIKNMNCTICESYNRMSSIIEYCLQNDIIFRVVISTALGCPYEGY
eukprot:294691_1